MTCIINSKIINELENHLENAYPEEGAGFLLGNISDDDQREITQIIKIENKWSEGPREDRFLITPQDVLLAEDQADEVGLTLLGIFHSHPDDINRPSEFDRAWALPWFSYIISTISGGLSTSHRAWRLSDDRSSFSEEAIIKSNNE